MCEHEQNFHALDVAFLFVLFCFLCHWATILSLEFSVFLFFPIIRCSCLKRASDTTQGFVWYKELKIARLFASRDCKFVSI